MVRKGGVLVSVLGRREWFFFLPGGCLSLVRSKGKNIRKQRVRGAKRKKQKGVRKEHFFVL